jgi:uncharacterized protein (DUF58 family)
MLSISLPDDDASFIDRDALHALGVLVPLRFYPVKVLPGRHPLGRAGDGMRILRTRPFIAGEDNPRDIDKFSPANELRVMEWEDEAQASVTLLVDRSASMASNLKAPLRNAAILQIMYSLWRAGDRVGVALFDTRVRRQIRAANLRSQLQQTVDALRAPLAAGATDVSAALNGFARQDRRRHSNLLFVISDFVAADGAEFRPERQWRTAINEIRQNIVPVIVSFELPRRLSGLIKLSDAQTGSRRLAWFTRRRIRDINRAERNRVADLERHFRSAGLDCLKIFGQRDVYPQLAALARVRRKRRL